MSMTCAFTSTNPSSNTANRPTGPAPMITASVSITPLLEASPARASTFIAFLVLAFAQVQPSARLELLCRDADHEPVHLGRNFYLTAEPARVADIEGEIEHV